MSPKSNLVFTAIIIAKSLLLMTSFWHHLMTSQWRHTEKWVILLICKSRIFHFKNCATEKCLPINGLPSSELEWCQIHTHLYWMSHIYDSYNAAPESRNKVWRKTYVYLFYFIRLHTNNRGRAELVDWGQENMEWFYLWLIGMSHENESEIIFCWSGWRRHLHFQCSIVGCHRNRSYRVC